MERIKCHGLPNNLGLSIGYGTVLFLVVAVGFGLMLTAFVPSQGTSQGGLAGSLTQLFTVIIVVVAAGAVLLMGPVVGLVVGVFAGSRHVGEPGRGFAAAFVASMIGYAVLLGVIVVVTASEIASVLPPGTSTSIPTPITTSGAESWRVIPLFLGTAITSGVAGAVVAHALRKGPEVQQPEATPRSDV